VIRRTAAVAALTCALALPQAAAASSNLFFGFSDDSLKYEPSVAVPIARDLGAQAFRVTLLWSKGQTDLDPTQIANFDSAVLGSEGMRVVVALYGKSNTDAPTDDASREQYCTFARSLLTRYPQINDIVVWNETNKQFFWKPQYTRRGASAAPAAYVKLLARCWEVLHAYRPQVNVLAAATSPRGNDRPRARSNVSHSPGAFIRKMGQAFRALNLDHRIFDTVAHHGYGPFSSERPWKRHSDAAGLISQGDHGALLAALTEAYEGTAQPLPGQCVEGWCVGIWYTEMGIQTRIDRQKRALYSGRESDPRAVPDDAGAPGWNPEGAPVPDDSSAPDQATQITDARRLAYCLPYVDAFFNLQLWDEPDLGRWQSAPLWADRTPKDSYAAFQQAIAAVNADTIDCGAVKWAHRTPGSDARREHR
jgi:hypothetical protein